MTAETANIAADPTQMGSGEGRGAFHGDPGALFNILFKGVLLTVFTLGIYRFWMKTDLRRHYWGATRIDGEPLEYTGRPLELLLGFLIAIFFLAIYLAAVNFALSFASLAYWQGYEPAAFLSFLTVLPLLPYAKYRAQRYLLSRTRWKGVRFGLDLSAWSYTWRSLLWSTGSIVTLGLLYPLADFELRRFITKRMTFGDQRFALTGTAGGLYRGFLGLWAFAATALICVAALGFLSEAGSATLESSLIGPLILLAAISGVAAAVAYLWYGAFRLKYILSRMEVAGPAAEPARLGSDMSPRRVALVVVGGLLLTMLVTIAVAVGASLAFGGLFAAAAYAFPEVVNVFDPATADAPPGMFALWPFFVFVGLLYLTIGVAAVISAEIFVNRRFVEKVVEGLRIDNVAAMSKARQQDHVDETGAEGFADALDVGAF